MFLDETKIFLTSGSGGDGIVHFRREKYVPRGGPDGGNGGKGGDVILVVDPRLNTLSNFRRKRHYQAGDASSGGGNNKTGRSGEDLEILVPPGTLVRDATSGALLGDLVDHNQRLVVCHGGRAGKGNARYASSRNQTPHMAEKGEPGEEKTLLLELRLIADVGIVGVPNAGKSTLLAAVTNAKPKIAEYPFTTLQPNLGVADLDELTSLILADIPGLIEGAHKGTGLGFAFLRHIERTRVLIHVIDGSSENPIADFSQVNAEMALFSASIAQKPQIVAINKIDLPDVEDRLSALTEMISERGYESFPISAMAHRGLRELLWSAHERLSQLEPQPIVEDTLPVYGFEDETIPFEISREPDGAWRVSGEEVERAAAMTYWEFDEAIARFQQLLVHLGVEDALREAGITSGETVRISDYELEWLT